MVLSEDGLADMDESSIKEDATIYSYSTGMSGHSLASGGHNNQEDKVEDLDVEAIAQHEHEEVKKSKLLVFVVLFVTLAAMSTITYVLFAKGQDDDFRTQFQNYASEVIAVSQQNVATTIRTIDTFGNTITSHASTSNESWPFVRLPDFESRGSALIELASANIVMFAPYVSLEQKREWESYSRKNSRLDFKEAIDYQSLKNISADSIPVSPVIFTFDAQTYETEIDTSLGPFLPAWQIAPFSPEGSFINVNLVADNRVANAFFTSLKTKKSTLSFFSIGGNLSSNIVQPVFEHVSKDKQDQKVVGVVWMPLSWEDYLRNILPQDAGGIIVIVESTCGDIMTFRINGPECEFVGDGDHHNSHYNDLLLEDDFFSLKDVNDNSTVELPDGLCMPELTVRIYPSDQLRDVFITKQPTLYACAVVFVFLFTSFVFLIYDVKVRRRQAKVMDRVIRQHQLVSDMFPAEFRDRLYKKKFTGTESMSLDDSGFERSDPIADLFPDASIFFADISGFTAWSSTREPIQVFKLLESIFGCFDRFAYRHGVFKVETVGDCYVAVSGLPEPNENHATAVARFARDCMHAMRKLTRHLEISLGPDTADLAMRMGIHSGQVTAGVLRGDRSRFQLFGDTVNTASRMETTGERNKIQISNVTASILREKGKGKWIKPRLETVLVKGKGHIQTYWLETKAESKKRPRRTSIQNTPEMAPLVEEEEGDEDEVDLTDPADIEDDEIADFVIGNAEGKMTKTERLVEWNVDMLSFLLKQIISARGDVRPPVKSKLLVDSEAQIGLGATVLEEFKEIITLPTVAMEDLERRKDPNMIELEPVVVSQLRDLITQIAGIYRNNAFHNFDHASHVTASVRKLLSRIVSYSDPMTGLNQENKDHIALVDRSGHSYGITSDPLTQFSVVFSAVIHDADHPGVPNTQLVKEKVAIASKYKEKSVAEQNSVDLAWDLLMEPKYSDLRACIYTNERQLKRFRQLVVNTVMATDICDKELNALRKARWNMAFSETPIDTIPEDDKNRKATIVIEHLIQASDVSHTMQHWHVYLKWNELFFIECYGAYKAGRAESDPSVGWYKGEIGFFDFYIIPLAKKLENCGVFGVSSHEYLNYALGNREEWAREGKTIVKGYIANYGRRQEEQNSDDAISVASHRSHESHISYISL